MVALEVSFLIIGGIADVQISISDATSLFAANPASELILSYNMNHVLKTVSDEEENKATYSDPGLSLAGGNDEGIYSPYIAATGAL